jgi:hypothetical protein
MAHSIDGGPLLDKIDSKIRGGRNLLQQQPLV